MSKKKNKKTVLFFSDSPFFQLTIGKTLEELYCRMEKMETREDLLDELEDAKEAGMNLDLIVIKDSSDIEYFLKRIHRINDDIPVIVFKASPEQINEQVRSKYPITVMKIPFQQEEVLKKIEKLLN